MGFPPARHVTVLAVLLVGVGTASPGAIEYAVDASGHRTGKKVDGALVQGFVYENDDVVAELDGTGNVVSTFRGGVMVRGGVAYRLVRDERGSVRAVVNASTGAILQRIDYDPFGRVISDSNPGFQPFGYAGGLYDRDTGLVHFGARDYDPATGRWISKDPIGFGGGDANLYAYVANDPVDRRDPSGLAESQGEPISWLGKGFVPPLPTTAFDSGPWSARPPRNTCSEDQIWGALISNIREMKRIRAGLGEEGTKFVSNPLPFHCTDVTPCSDPKLAGMCFFDIGPYVPMTNKRGVTDPCVLFCTNVHEYVHNQDERAIPESWLCDDKNYSKIDPFRELPAYRADNKCLLTFVNGDRK